ncbi:hypothetical protein INR49_014036 [Caranx melampygus]|nr:hypothetical protein INR49_014036 [Caranx melampygus]
MDEKVQIVSCNVLESGEANSFGTYDRSNSLCVFAVADHPTLAHYERIVEQDEFAKGALLLAAPGEDTQLKPVASN